MGNSWRTIVFSIAVAGLLPFAASAQTNDAAHQMCEEWMQKVKQALIAKQQPPPTPRCFVTVPCGEVTGYCDGTQCRATNACGQDLTQEALNPNISNDPRYSEEDASPTDADSQEQNFPVDPVNNLREARYEANTAYDDLMQKLQALQQSTPDMQSNAQKAYDAALDQYESAQQKYENLRVNSTLGEYLKSLLPPSDSPLSDDPSRQPAFDSSGRRFDIGQTDTFNYTNANVDDASPGDPSRGTSAESFWRTAFDEMFGPNEEEGTVIASETVSGKIIDAISDGTSWLWNNTVGPLWDDTMVALGFQDPSPLPQSPDIVDATAPDSMFPQEYVPSEVIESNPVQPVPQPPDAATVQKMWDTFKNLQQTEPDLVGYTGLTPKFEDGKVILTTPGGYETSDPVTLAIWAERIDDALDKYLPTSDLPSSVPRSELDARGSNATSLADYYEARGQSLPSLADRRALYTSLGLSNGDRYTGTASQNARLLQALKRR